MTVLQVFRLPDFDMADDLALAHEHSVGVIKLSAAIEHEIHAFWIHDDMTESIGHPASERIPEHERVHLKELLNRRGFFFEHHLSQRKRQLTHAQIVVREVPD